MGLVLSGLLIRFGSLWVTMICHSVWNAVAALTIFGGFAAMSLLIRQAVPGDEQLVFDYVCKLADYENLRHEVAATVGDIRESLFGVTPRAYCDLAFWNGEPAGFALWFYNYSTFRGRAGIYLEDLFVDDAMRGKGIGKALLKHLAQRCLKGRIAAPAMVGAGLECAVD